MTSPRPALLLHWARLQRPVHHAPAVLFFTAVAMVWSFPLARHLGTHLPGDVAGDNLAFLWNVWWMREALARADVSFFHTDRLFAPFGIDLTLYTHTALPALIGATVLGRIPPIAAQNVLIVASLSLNGFAAYLLAYDRARDRGAALVAGLVFAGSPYIAAHLLGHFNLICAWSLPLFLLYFDRALERHSIRAAIAAAVVVVAVAYTDYYYVVYCVALAAVLILSDLRPVHVAFTNHALSPLSRRVLAALLALDLLIVVAIVVSGGFDTTIASVRIRADRPTNLLAFAWMLVAIWLLLKVRPSVRLRAVASSDMWRHLRLWTPAGAVVIVGMLPLMIGAWRLWHAGGYVAPRPSWRSGPGGVDLATLVLGNPLHPLSGAWTRAIYARFAIDRVESVAWMGVAPVVFTAWAVLRHWDDRHVRRWLLLAAVFFVWALGPWLHVAGFNTGLLLPQNFFAYVPILSNARMPGRAVSVVFLGVGVAIAVAVSHVPPRGRRLAVIAALVLIGIDFIPAPFPLTAMDVPAFFADLRERRDGWAVCELPVGVRDGFGSFGRFDDHALLDATIHEHPIVGGSTSRLPPQIAEGYRQIPVLRSLFRLSQEQSVDRADAGLSRDETGAALLAANVGYIVLNRATASSALVRYVEENVPLELLRTDGTRQLYVITGGGPPSAPPAR